MSPFARRLFAATCIMHIPFVLAAMGVLARVGLSDRLACVVASALATLGIGRFYRSTTRSGYDRKTDEGQLLRDRAYHMHWCAIAFLFVASALSIFVLPFTGFSLDYFGAAYAIGLAISAWGIFVRRRWFVVRRYDIAVDGLPEAFNGFRIAQLSDLHIGSHTPKEWGFEWARAANAEAADIIVVTGDMVTSGVAFHEDIAEVVGRLSAEGGVYVSMGNHDYFDEGEPLIGLLRERDVVVLRNEGRVVVRSGEQLYVAGVDDTWTRRASMEKTMQARPEGAATVLLAHDPSLFKAAAELGVELVLSGHTHGGQVAVPFLPRLSFGALAHGYNLGLYYRGRSTLYVHPGLGTTGPPIRLGVAPAVTVLTLRRR